MQLQESESSSNTRLSKLASEGNFPSELKALINKRFAFKIAIASFNIK
ncbi:hypothetical protein Hanom_Chr13g01230011 [Helianthus anomalus]